MSLFYLLLLTSIHLNSSFQTNKSIIVLFSATFFDKRTQATAGPNVEIVNQVVKDSTSSSASSSSSSSSTTKSSSSLDRATIEASTIEERILERYSDATTTSKSKQPTKKMISRGGAASKAVLERLKIGVYFGLWYALNVVYNSKYDT